MRSMGRVLMTNKDVKVLSVGVHYSVVKESSFPWVPADRSEAQICGEEETRRSGRENRVHEVRAKAKSTSTRPGGSVG